MAEANQDMWSQWLLQRRFGGDPKRLQLVMGFLYPIRDKVLEHAALGEHKVLLDVGCGDGLIAFGALEKVPTSQVIFSDISPELLKHAEEAVREMGVHSRCQFLQAAADNLSEVPSAAVDVVTTRSVLIYVADKQQAFTEFYRVLKPQGRLSIFEPINRFGQPEPSHQFWGYDVAPVKETADKIKELYRRLQPLETDPMMNFDERDLLAFAEQAGFRDIHLELQVQVKPPNEHSGWEAMLLTAGNPKIPTLEEAMNQVLTPNEREAFISHLRPLVEAKQGVRRMALTYLWATKQ